MAEKITNYQCPACTGPLQYSARTDNLECEYCGSSFETATIEEMYAKQEARAAAAMAAEKETQTEWDASDLNDNWGEDGKGMKAYQCPSCGAELICDETTAATACPYCGNPSVIPGQFAGSLRPDYILPFRLKKEDAIARLEHHYEGKKFLPNTFRARSTVEKIQGVYVPFWLYDGQVSGDYMFRTSEIYSYRDYDSEVTVTKHYQVERAGTMAFEKVPVDAASKMPDDYMDSIEPFDYRELRPFSTAYLPGFLADKYDVSVEEANDRADIRCIQSLEDALRDTVTGYTFVQPCADNIARIERGKVHYALLPVWLLNVKWGGETHLFAINGQSGKVAGRLPVSKGKVFAFFAKIAAPLSALGIALAYMIVR